MGDLEAQRAQFLAQDRRAIRGYYNQIDTWYRLLGAEEMGRRYVVVRLDRYLLNTGIDFGELRRILAGVANLDTWYTAWMGAAERHAALGEAAEALDHRVTAAEAYRRAACLALFATLNAMADDPRRLVGQRQSFAWYRHAAPLFDPPSEPIAIPFRGHTLPGYLRRPRGVDNAPCVLLVEGADSTKEELHAWTEHLLRRGLATLTFDGPGQGEAAPRHGGPPMELNGHEKALSAAIDALVGQPGIDTDRIGLLGISMGGYLCTRGAATDRRVKACVSNGGVYDLRDFDKWNIGLQVAVRDDLGLATLAETFQAVAETCSLRDVIGQLRCPYMVLHGAMEDLLSLEESRQMAQEAAGPRVLLVVRDAYHLVMNRSLDAYPEILDFLADHLYGRAPMADGFTERWIP